MDNMFLQKQLCRENIDGLPDFFNFIEQDLYKIFSENGKFIICNVFKLSDINKRYGRETGDLCIKVFTECISQAIADQEEVYPFRFGTNDFLIPLPTYLKLDADRIKENIAEQFKNNIAGLGCENIAIDSWVFEYHQEISTVEDFYSILINNILISDKEEKHGANSQRLIKHIIYDFMANVRKSLSCYRDVWDLALTDDISGLPNHRSARLYMEKLIEQYKYTNVSFSILFIDGDNLRRYNKISYEAGNNVIRKLASIIENCIRSEDKLFRWLCGDEFLIVLPDTNIHKSLQIANVIKGEVQKQTRKLTYPTTVSIGIANYPSDGQSIEEVILRAEEANNIAKKTGKNKIVIWKARAKKYIISDREMDL